MAVLASEISELQKAHGEAVEAQYLEMDKQRRFFVGKIEALREELKKLKKGRSESEKQVTRVRERNMGGASMTTEEEESSQTQNRRRKGSASTPANLNIKLQLEKQSYAVAAASKPAQAPEKPWTQVQNNGRKPSSHQLTKGLANIEHQGRRILFPRNTLGQQMSEADLMLALNEALQKAGEGLETRFFRVRYSPSGAVSALLTEKANAGSLIPRLSNVHIRAAKKLTRQ